ncbi:protein EI24 homolog isoform X2 [Prunus dulcis]|uniref:protein EI24 homolog isoform X2 n=1 Tax=Prunus dulcis TaxID=3755 RepID=UPI00148205F1|nr:protein EI24 homolog isoform X2 [Prunus dulcis]
MCCVVLCLSFSSNLFNSILKRMEAAKPLINAFRTKSKQATLLWLEGFREACCLHRVFILCYRSRKLLIRTGQCFLLNGFIFLGSIIILNSVIVPALHWILPDRCPEFSSQELCSFGGILKFYSFLRLGLIQLFYVTWFYPLYVFSIILSNIWYNDIAKYGFAAMGRSGPTTLDPVRQNEASALQIGAGTERPTGLGGVMIGIGEQVYSLLLLSCFFLEVYVTGFIPYAGKALNFLLLSWMYKWNFSEVRLDKRLDFFESNWAFFAGFGSPCVLPVLFFSPLVSYGFMAILFPLFVLTATGSEAEQVISSQRTKWEVAGFGRLPIFNAADTLSMRVLSLFPQESQELLQKKKDS